MNKETRTKTLTVLALSTASLIGCGSGTTTENPIVNPPSANANLKVVSVFEGGVDDESGVAIGKAGDGEQIAFYSFYIDDYVDLANNGENVGLLEVDENALHPMQRLNATTSLYEGVKTIDRMRYSVRLIKDDEDEAVMFAYIDPDFNAAIVAKGIELEDIPSGEHEYTGTLYVFSNEESHYGEFTLTADFSDESFVIVGETADGLIELQATGVIDKVKGTIGSSTASFVRNGEDGSGSIYGQLHGDRARSVSGIFHARDDGTIVNYIGGFVGSR